MYSKELIETYMKFKNYSQHKQMAADMKISTSYLSDIYNNKRQFTDESGIWIAIECELDPGEVLIKLAEARAKSPETRSVWAEAVKRYCVGNEAAACAGLAVLAALFAPTHLFALCILC